MSDILTYGNLLTVTDGTAYDKTFDLSSQTAVTAVNRIKFYYFY